MLTDHIDIANARLEFSNGAVANVIASRVSRDKMRRIRVFEHHRYQSWTSSSRSSMSPTRRKSPASPGPRSSPSASRSRPVKPLDAEIDAFTRCVRSGEAPLVGGPVGLRALEVALRVKATIEGPEERRRRRSAGHLQGLFYGGAQAAGIGPAAAGQIQRRAVIHRGAHQRQAEGDIDGVAESLVFEHRQALVVVHRQHCVGTLQMGCGEQGVRGQGPPGTCRVLSVVRAPARSPRSLRDPGDRSRRHAG